MPKLLPELISRVVKELVVDGGGIYDSGCQGVIAQALLILTLSEVSGTKPLQVGLHLYFLHLFLRNLMFHLCLRGNFVIFLQGGKETMV